MNVVIFDFEVFKYDTLLGTLTINGDNLVYKQMWSLDEIKNFYKAHIDDIWVGHNNDAYDNHILKAIISGKTDIFRLSKHLINQEFRSRADLDIYTYDTMCCNYFSLKLTELCGGKKIQTSEVDFNIDRPLTETEKLETEQYNRADLAQTYENFTQMVDTMLMRLRLLTEFDIPKKFLTATEARLASTALSAEQIPGIEEQYIKPEMYPTLQIKNQAVIDYYQNECFRKKGENRLTVTLCGLPHSIGSGGIHAAAKKCHETNIIYLAMIK